MDFSSILSTTTPGGSASNNNAQPPRVAQPEIKKWRAVNPVLPIQKSSYTKCACNSCRSLHLKCDGKNPCQQCQRRGIKCFFETVQKRGGKTKEMTELVNVLMWKLATAQQKLSEYELKLNDLNKLSDKTEQTVDTNTVLVDTNSSSNDGVVGDRHADNDVSMALLLHENNNNNNDNNNNSDNNSQEIEIYEGGGSGSSENESNSEGEEEEGEYKRFLQATSSIREEEQRKQKEKDEIKRRYEKYVDVYFKYVHINLPILRSDEFQSPETTKQFLSYLLHPSNPPLHPPHHLHFQHQHRQQQQKPNHQTNDDKQQQQQQPNHQQQHERLSMMRKRLKVLAVLTIGARITNQRKEAEEIFKRWKEEIGASVDIKAIEVAESCELMSYYLVGEGEIEKANIYASIASNICKMMNKTQTTLYHRAALMIAMNEKSYFDRSNCLMKLVTSDAALNVLEMTYLTFHIVVNEVIIAKNNIMNNADLLRIIMYNELLLNQYESNASLHSHHHHHTSTSHITIAPTPTYPTSTHHHYHINHNNNNNNNNKNNININNINKNVSSNNNKNVNNNNLQQSEVNAIRIHRAIIRATKIFLLSHSNISSENIQLHYRQCESEVLQIIQSHEYLYFDHTFIAALLIIIRSYYLQICITNPAIDDPTPLHSPHFDRIISVLRSLSHIYPSILHPIIDIISSPFITSTSSVRTSTPSPSSSSSSSPLLLSVVRERIMMIDSKVISLIGSPITSDFPTHPSSFGLACHPFLTCRNSGQQSPITHHHHHCNHHNHHHILPVLSPNGNSPRSSQNNHHPHHSHHSHLSPHSNSHLHTDHPHYPPHPPHNLHHTSSSSPSHPISNNNNNNNNNHVHNNEKDKNRAKEDEGKHVERSSAQNLVTQRPHTSHSPHDSHHHPQLQSQPLHNPSLENRRVEYELINSMLNDSEYDHNMHRGADDNDGDDDNDIRVVPHVANPIIPPYIHPHHHSHHNYHYDQSHPNVDFHGDEVNNHHLHHYDSHTEGINHYSQNNNSSWNSHSSNNNNNNNVLFRNDSGILREIRVETPPLESLIEFQSLFSSIDFDFDYFSM